MIKNFILMHRNRKQNLMNMNHMSSGNLVSTNPNSELAFGDSVSMLYGTQARANILQSNNSHGGISLLQ